MPEFGPGRTSDVATRRVVIGLIAALALLLIATPMRGQRAAPPTLPQDSGSGKLAQDAARAEKATRPRDVAAAPDAAAQQLALLKPIAAMQAGVVLVQDARGSVAGELSSDSKVGGVDVPDLERMQRQFEEVAQRASASVVGVRVKRRRASLPLPHEAAAGREEPLIAVNGSGTVIRADGYILTNEHVVQTAARIEVVFHDGTIADARVHAADARADLAILHVQRMGLTAARFCDWSSVARGQWTLALGNPFGLGGDGKPSLSVGVISNLDRRLPGLGDGENRAYDDMLQTTAVINPGNSGGPLFNVRGELVGVITAMHTRNAADDGAGFAIPLTPARREKIESLLGSASQAGYLGMSVRTPRSDERDRAGLQVPRGAVVQEVEADGPAFRAGLLPGDLLLRFNGRTVDDPTGLLNLVSATPIGQRVRIEASRDAKALLLEIVVESRTPAAARSLSAR